MVKISALLGRIERFKRDVRSILRTGSTEGGFARKRLQQLRWKYFDDKERYYQTPNQRKKLSADSLYIFPGAYLLIEEATHSIASGNFVEAHAKIDQAQDVLREAAHKRFEDGMTFYAREQARAKKK